MTICPICKKEYTKKNYPENSHLKYKNPEETFIGCKNCNHAEYYYRYPDELKKQSRFWRWWWKNRINLVMNYYEKNRTMLKAFQNPDN